MRRTSRTLTPSVKLASLSDTGKTYTYDYSAHLAKDGQHRPDIGLSKGVQFDIQYREWVGGKKPLSWIDTHTLSEDPDLSLVSGQDRCDIGSYLNDGYAHQGINGKWYEYRLAPRKLDFDHAHDNQNDDHMDDPMDKPMDSPMDDFICEDGLIDIDHLSGEALHDEEDVAMQEYMELPFDPLDVLQTDLARRGRGRPSNVDKELSALLSDNDATAHNDIPIFDNVLQMDKARVTDYFPVTSAGSRRRRTPLSIRKSAKASKPPIVEQANDSLLADETLPQERLMIVNEIVDKRYVRFRIHNCRVVQVIA